MKTALLVLILLLGNTLQIRAQTQTIAGQDSLKIPAGDSELQTVIENFDFRDTDIRDVVRLLATNYNLNIFIDNSISLRITLHLTNVKVIDALHFIVDENNLRLIRMENIFKILPQAISEPKPKQILVEYQNGLLSLDFDNENIADALRAVSEKSGETILLDRNVSGKISGLIRQKPFEFGLQQLLENNGFKLEKRKGIYVVRMESTPMAGGEGTSVRSRGNFYVNVEDTLVTIDVQNAPINELLQEAARRLNKNVFIYGTIEGTISARVENLDFVNFLNFIFQGTDVTYKVQDGIFLIGNKTVKGISSSELIKLNYLKTDNITKQMPEALISKAEIKPIIEQNGIMVTGTKGVIKEIKDYIDEIDRPSPQILFEVLVIDFNTSKIRDISVQAGYSKEMQAAASDTSGQRINSLLPGIDLLFDSKVINRYIDKAGNFLGIANIGHLPEDFFVKVEALESQGLAQIRSKPQIATLNGYPADISVGQTQYYKLVSRTPYRDTNQLYLSETETFQTIEANISLKITPWVSASGEITAEIHPEFKTPVGSFSSTVPPTIQSRALNSTVRLHDGETIVLGGLIKNGVDETVRGIPYLRDIPVLGGLFESKSYNKYSEELIIYVTPHLYYMDE